MVHHFDPTPRPPRSYRESDHDPNRDRTPRVWNLVWALLILATVSASANVDLAAAAAELRHRELGDWQAAICEGMPDGTAFADVFDLDDHPSLWQDDGYRDGHSDNFERTCDFGAHTESTSRRLTITLGDVAGNLDARLGRPRLELSGLADTAELTPPDQDPAGGVSLYSTVGDTTMAVTVVDQTRIETLTQSATNGSFPYRRLIDDATTATAEAWALIGHPDPGPPPPADIDTARFPRSLCEDLPIPDTDLEPVAANWPPTTDAVGRCEWHSDAESDRDPAEIFYVRVDPATAVPAADTTAEQTASWLWAIRDPEVGDEIPDLGPDSAIGVAEGLGGAYFRWHGHLIQIFHKTPGDENSSRTAILRAARDVADRLGPNTSGD